MTHSSYLSRDIKNLILIASVAQKEFLTFPVGGIKAVHIHLRTNCLPDRPFQNF